MSRSPRHSLTLEDLAKLQSDNQDFGDFWILVDETHVSIAHQKKHQEAIRMVSIPRGEWMSMVDWFNKEQPIEA